MERATSLVLPARGEGRRGRGQLVHLHTDDARPADRMTRPDPDKERARTHHTKCQWHQAEVSRDTNLE